MELILVRHAEPFAAPTIDDSPADPPLGERGREQARRVAEWLTRERLDRVISSPALRARETAAPAAERAGVPIEIDDRVRDAEPQAGRYVPLEIERGRDRERYLERVAAYRDSPRLVEIAARVHAALDACTRDARGTRVAVFCHGSVVNVYAAHVLGLDNAAFLEADYASGHRFLISGAGVRSVKSLNETGHLIR